MGERDELEAVKVAVGGKGRSLRVRECRNMMRKRLAREYEGIVEGFIAAAKKGSCPHVKLATELLREPVQRPRAGKKGSATLLMEKLDREEAERAMERG